MALPFWPRMLGYLEVADIDYLSARALMLNGLVTTALPKAAEALEKIMKLLLAIEAKLNRGEEFDSKRFREFGHDLGALSAELQERMPTQHSASRTAYCRRLQETYRHRYPENRPDDFTYEGNIDAFDGQYVFLRNQVARNFPPDHVAAAQTFAVFSAAAFGPQMTETIAELGGQPPGHILRASNKSVDSLDAVEAWGAQVPGGPWEVTVVHPDESGYS